MTMNFRMRLLDPAEFPQLEQLPGFAHLNGQLPNPDHMQVVVVERLDEAGAPTGQLLGFWALVLVPHSEPLWVAPEARNTPGVLLALLDGMQGLMKEAGLFQGTMVVADEKRVQDMALRLGLKPVGQAYILPTVYAPSPPLQATTAEAGSTSRPH